MRDSVGRLMSKFRRRATSGSPVQPVRSLLRLLALGNGAFARPQLTSTLLRQRVLVLAPHPDDEVIGMGGALVRHAANGSEIVILYLTDGGGMGDDRAQLIAQRRSEAESIAARYPLRQIFWEHPDTRRDPRNAVSGLRPLLLDLRPETIYLPSFFEHHFDHFAANALLHLALDGLELQPWIVGYEVWDSLGVTNHVVDISDAFQAKIELMRQYRTPMQYTDFVALIQHRAAMHFLLHVDSRRRDPEGYAEAYCRLGAAEFARTFTTWCELLRLQGSPLIDHLERL